MASRESSQERVKGQYLGEKMHGNRKCPRRKMPTKKKGKTPGIRNIAIKSE